MRLLLLCAVVALAHGAPHQSDRDAEVLFRDYTIDEKGNYSFGYSISNGITRSETGTLVNEGQPDEHISVKGEFSYINTEGVEVVVQYIADENGYRILPGGGDMTVISELPAAITASLLGK